MAYWQDEESLRCEAQLKAARAPSYDGGGKMLLRPDGRPELWLRPGKASPGVQYWQPDLFTWPDDAVVWDLGAYTGDTIEAFLKAGVPWGIWYAFEPDPKNYETLHKRFTGRGDVVALPWAVGSERGEIEFLALGDVRSKKWCPGPTPAIRVQVVTLDELGHFLQPTFLKMDIERMEQEALRGGLAMLRLARPVLAISVYHDDEAVSEVPALIREAIPDAKLYLRCHHDSCQDTVLYAVPPERSIG